jgi:hypothetical protein
VEEQIEQELNEIQFKKTIPCELLSGSDSLKGIVDVTHNISAIMKLTSTLPKFGKASMSLSTPDEFMVSPLVKMDVTDGQESPLSFNFKESVMTKDGKPHRTDGV